MELAKRDLKQAMRRGVCLRCPNCGKGHLMAGYLKVAPGCTNCGQSFANQRADDGPAYFTILIVCHVAGFLLHYLIVRTDLGPLATMLITGTATIALALGMLPRIKGAMIGWQWAERMHGF